MKAFIFFILQHWKKQYLELQSFTGHTIALF